ncbi:MAG: L-serine ammonia-lyase, iron-sulfur-dependent, subunit alpha [Firmicutes bacterium]|uniref:L-serine dehydratase n=1 Tax=Candidatus Scybalomonas excrementavium TaxID=2840943 RepID=A0A9D9I0R6_9FIRM|nr:L-serine ammonia-lyase, iron-sulfur-dependent, subunit alpha [Candidatus Scybalomonas excrementavium]
MDFRDGKELMEYCQKEQLLISEAMLQREIEELENGREETIEKMYKAWQIMKKSVERSLTEEIKSMGGLIGGESKKLKKLRDDKKNLCGTMISKAISYAVGVLEVNASMGLIVAAPTAGSSGVMPGTMLALQEEYGFDDEQIVQALFNASAIGYLITRNATTAGAEGGCQAEVGSASAMAASAIVELMGGTPKQCFDAASFALINLLGLVCDPVGGLVEFPCQLRNAQGATTALTSAEMALSGIECPALLDETIEIMYKVGKSIPSELRETSLGGMATSKGACSRCHMCH